MERPICARIKLWVSSPVSTSSLAGIEFWRSIAPVATPSHLRPASDSSPDPAFQPSQRITQCGHSRLSRAVERTYLAFASMKRRPVLDLELSMRWAHPRLDRQCLVIPLAFSNANMAQRYRDLYAWKLRVSSPDEPGKALPASKRKGR